MLSWERLERGAPPLTCHGAPVTTLDFDFAFRKTPTNIRKMKAFARALHATVLKPYYPASDMFRVVNDALGLQVDLMPTIHGIRSYEGLRARATDVVIAGATLRVARLEDIVRSKRAANRAKDRAVIAMSKRKQPSRAQSLRALRRESERALRDQIRRLLALPMSERTHFLRVRLPGGGSAL